jgi:hypothetical protein
MNAAFKIISFGILLTIASIENFAQDETRVGRKTPRWISDKGFWQIENNAHSPDKSIVYFYNNEKTLVYKEHVQGVVLDLSNNRVKMRLKKALEAALEAWKRNPLVQYDQQLISLLFKR